MADQQQAPTPEQAAQVLQQVQQQTQQQQAPPIRIQTQTGQVFEGATQDEVLQKLVHSVESGTSHIRELNQRLGQLEQTQQQQQQQQQTPPQQETFQEQYWRLWQQDPIAADRFAAATRLGVPVEQVDYIERSAILNAHATAQANALNTFYENCPDYPREDPQAANYMRAYLQQNFPGQQPTAAMFEVAFNELTRQGHITPLDVPIDDSDVQNPPPRVGPGQTAITPDFEAQFRGLTAEQQAKVIQELYAKGMR